MTRQPLPMFEAGVTKDVEPDDPMELVGVPMVVDEATFDEMASCLVEEYLRDGWSAEHLLGLFRSPFYTGLHVVWRRRGDAWVQDLISATQLRWQRPAMTPAQEAR